MSAPSGALRVRACAKINLTLRVAGLRRDGYHELRTTFQTLALHDTLIVAPSRGPLALTTDDPSCPTDPSNLVWKAAAALWRAAGRRGEPSGVRLHLRKRIPSQAGLGGGSSDAAAALVALGALWRTRIGDEEIERLARGLGADVPFFLHGGTMLGLDRGDLLFALPDVPPAWVVVAQPDFGVSTADAYAWWDAAQAGRPAAGPARAARRPAQRAIAAAGIPAGEWVNDLEAPVTARRPAIARLIDRLRRAGADYAAMSGSGSAVFALFAGRDRAGAAARQVAGPHVRVWTTRTLSRRQFRRAAAPGAAPAAAGRTR